MSLFFIKLVLVLKKQKKVLLPVAAYGDAKSKSASVIDRVNAP